MVELLVVIGIIAVLIALLLPALNKAREQAISVTCQSNERQILMSLIMYSNDNKNHLLLPPRIGDTFAAQSPLGYFCPQAGFLDYNNGAFWPYLSTSVGLGGGQGHPQALERVFNCPGDGDLRNYGSGVVRNFSYSWNGELDNRVPVNIRKYTQVKDPDHKIVLVEERLPNDGCAFIADGTFSPADDPAYRHAKAANFGFADAHVERRGPYDLGFTNVNNNDVNATEVVRDYSIVQSYFNLQNGQ